MTNTNSSPHLNARSPAAPADGVSLPVLAPEALYGLPGEVVRAVDPHTEAHPAAILGQFLVYAGNVVGPGPHFVVEARPHALNEFVVLVGPTSKGRKGTSQGRVDMFFKAAAPTWFSAENIASGLSSGEGLIYRVRDPSAVDHLGVADKRLLVCEAEYGRVLQQSKREGNVLSHVIRDAWDGTPLAILTKNAPQTSTGHHISIVAHVTSTELQTHTARFVAEAGHHNRFFYLSVARTKVLPRGGREIENHTYLSEWLRETLEHGSSIGQMDMTEEAWAVWERVYVPLSSDRPGLFGATTGRAEAHVRRLSCIYAMLDESESVCTEHLLAGLGVWQYAEESAYQIFGTPVSDPDGDRVMAGLANNGGKLDLSGVSRVLSNHRTSEALSELGDRLENSGMIVRSGETSEGRPRVLWTRVEGASLASSRVGVVTDYMSLARTVVAELRAPQMHQGAPLGGNATNGAQGSD